MVEWFCNFALEPALTAGPGAGIDIASDDEMSKLGFVGYVPKQRTGFGA